MHQPIILNIEQAGVVAPVERVGFLRRQFRPPVTKGEVIFDLVFGALLPVLCFVCDPVVFRGSLLGQPLLGGLRMMAYTAAFLEIMALLIWLVRRERTGAHAITLGGVMLAGALVSFSIGLLILPLSLMGIFFFGIGLFGFIPFLTAMVFLRNGWRAVRARDERPSRGRVLGAFFLGVVLAVGGPGSAQLEISRLASRSLVEVVEGHPREVQEALARLKVLRYLTDLRTGDIARAYWMEQDPARRKRLAEAHFAITGRDIESGRASMD